MKFQSCLKVLTIGAIATLGFGCASPELGDETSPNTETKANRAKEISFICAEGYHTQSQKRLPTTFAWSPRGKIAVIRFKTEHFKAAGYPPEKRCKEIAPRFDTAYKNGSIKFITNGEMKNQAVICTAREYRGECDTLLITLREEDDADNILLELAETLKGRQEGGVVHSSEDAQVYYKVDIEEFLATAPVEVSDQ